ncbi:high-potential iron-sulfur protein [Halobaculum rubrum]|uniref:high-potential iron-sulfur protein n=1 Tax=Halobaculum rubrum TaxID=2872158 RepID=UPI001CA3D861|nr:high-potential iron-sulfur protein [Halobaculum rubrum]QZY00906.1 high-potential iron-sulfur protein [Halobaculum rubrum]
MIDTLLSGDASSYDMWSRRNYLVATVGIAAVSGCTGDGGGEATEPTAGAETETEPTGTQEEGGETEEELPEGVSEDEFERGPVPDVYLSATSLGNETRNPDELNTKADVGFSEFDEAVENAAHQPGTCCANCADFVPDKNGDGFGACAEVEGYIGGEDWCTIYESLPEPSVPAGMSEDDLATAAVPEAYRTANSAGGEKRTPDDLLAQADVNLTESVEAIAEGTAMPGQSCGNCAEFIPDRNGDGWGACAKVEGYIAAEDWCSVWEHITEEL